MYQYVQVNTHTESFLFNLKMLYPYTGISLLAGLFGLQLYTLAQSKDTKVELYDRHIGWGLLTLLFVWGPGVIRVIFLAKKRDWRTLTCCQRTFQTFYYITLALIWPVFSPLL